MESYTDETDYLEPYDTFDIAIFVIHDDSVHTGHFGGMYDNDGKLLETIEEQCRPFAPWKAL
jgi:hypothetical protein